MIRCEIPNSDAYRVFSTWGELFSFLTSHDVTQVRYDKQFNVYRVPAFADSRKRYTQAKAEDCARWGCE